MKTFKTNIQGRTIILRLDQGDDVLGSIRQVVKEEDIQNGVVVSGIGTLDYCKLHMVLTTTYPPVEHFEVWENKPLEIASIDGIIANYEPHLHTVVSDHEKAYAGHLEDGCRVLYLAEIVIQEILGLDLIRQQNEKGINELIKR